MTEYSLSRRDVIRGAGAAGAAGLLARPATATPDLPSTPYAKATYRAVVDAIVPRTPQLASELGPEHVPGGIDVGLDEYLIEFVDSIFTFGTLGDGDVNLPLSEPLAVVLDVAALKLVATGRNSEPPSLERVLGLLDVDDLLAVDELSDDPERALQQSLFAGLSRRDRLEAVELLDAIDFDTAFLPGPVAEIDLALVGQLVVAFVEVIYYSEWQGYEDITRPPSEREFSGEDIQSWQQTDFPGIIDGAAALRGFWSAPGEPLGEGSVWGTATPGEEPRRLRARPGEFRENDYDTSDYEEVFSTDGTPATEGPVGDAVSAVTGDVGVDPEEEELPASLTEGLVGLDEERPAESLLRDVVARILGGDPP
ncbi:hypothetical protein [Natronomonas marina]|jgi:hypothetical protein|uniref:hypothetical protein n=1 Tax=Natronomonas marina TaxID=2961939 RepID=UPI0020C990EE|nr:hypothetical protein [Natronomonas marina]